MTPSSRESAISIWQAGVNAVRAETLIDRYVQADKNALTVCGTNYSLGGVGKFCLVGAGKAAGYLAVALEQKLAAVTETKVEGWVNVPANCLVPIDKVTLHAARPAEVNEPRPEGVYGTQEILRQVSELDTQDLCICVLTGGGSALLPAPAPGILLDDKISVTRLLSERGATIQELNRVRTALSLVKGGGLARACRANRLVTLIISDVIGDPLDVISSGPTVVSTEVKDEPDRVLRRYANESQVSARVWDALKQYRDAAPPTCEVTHHLLANNSTAVEAAASEARGRGFQVTVIPPEPPKTHVETVARQLAERIPGMDRPGCIIWGGEPIIHLVAAQDRGLGGRNQHLVLELFRLLTASQGEFPAELCILSGGTDGEDGPTDAAGSFVDAAVTVAVQQKHLNPASFLQRNDAYSFFQQVGGLLRTGPTHTNVCDLRVVVYQ